MRSCIGSGSTGSPEHRASGRRRIARAALALCILLAGPTARADLDGHGPDAWRVTGVAAGDVLNARMGPGTDYAVITTFAPGERGLQQVTCVPLVPQATWMQMTKTQRNALPQPWCLMRSPDRVRAGWVARRYLGEDTRATGAAAPAPAATSRVATAPAVPAAPSSNANGCAAPTLTGGTARTSASLLERVQQDTDRFTGAAGYRPLDAGPGASGIDWDRVYTQARFPDSGQSALLPDADMGAVARAMLVFEAVEGPILHPRYHVTYHLRQVSDDCDTIPTAYVQVTRYNLGTTRYEEATRYVDKAYWPPRETFGPGPHVSWRLALGPVQGRYADIRQASRRVVDDAAAAAADCLGQPCLALEDAVAPGSNWQPTPLANVPAPVYREPDYDWAPGPVRLAELLYTQATGSHENIEASEGTSFEHPDMTLVISRDVQGQDSNTRGLLKWQGLMDDDLAQIWQRIRAMPQGGPRAEQLLVQWPNRVQPQPASPTVSQPAQQATQAQTPALPHELLGDELIDGATLLVRDLYHAFATAQAAADNPFSPAPADRYFFADVVPQLAGHGADLLYDAQDFDGAILRIGPNADQPMFRGTIWIEVDYRNFGAEKRANFRLRADTQRPGPTAPFRIFSIGHDDWEFP